MPNKNILKQSTVLFVLLIFSGLAWGNQQKTSAPPPSKPAPPASRPAAPPASKPPAQQQRKPQGQVRPPSGPTKPSGAAAKPSAKPPATATLPGRAFHPGAKVIKPKVPAGGRANSPSLGSTRPKADLNPSLITTTRIVPLKGGGTAQLGLGGNGRVTSIQARGMAINYGRGGGRTIVSEHNGHTIVSSGPHSGYVQRTYVTRDGHAYVQRTYMVGGHPYARAYRVYEYGGVRYYTYVPVYYYHPVFYAWAYGPWGQVYCGPAAWGWVGTPWFRFYGGYFMPYPVYPTASLWLTDYVIAANLQAAYQAGVDANASAANGVQPPADNSGAPPPGGPAASYQTDGKGHVIATPLPPPDASAISYQAPLSPEVKQAIADEVKSQLAAEQAAASNPSAAPSSEQIPDALNPAERVFVVGSSLDVMGADSGPECSLTAGDVVMRLSDTPDANLNVTASVQSSKKADCARGRAVAVSVQDLQEMHNSFREQLDSGLKALADNSGKMGLPKAPDTATTTGEVPPPTPDSGVADQLQAQQQQADHAELEVLVAQPK